VEWKRKLEEENSQLKSQINDLRAEVEKQKQKINELKEKHQVLKIAKTIESDDNNKEAIRQLDFYIKEIDRCIALLNS
jgi:predicted nuclease with TOPRIM domain